MKRLLFLAAVLLPHCTGCVAFAYPTVALVPELKVPNQDGSVHAFRVDVDTTMHSTQYTLARIPVGPRGVIASQLEIAPATGVLNPFKLDGVTEERNNYTMLVRLYRPGYRTIEVPAWDKARELQWLPAADLAAQEKAVDDLLAPSSQASWWDQKDNNAGKTQFDSLTHTLSFSCDGLQPGSASSMHRNVLQFVASEYGRLANSSLAHAPDMQSVRERLQQKAIWLKRWADEAPPKTN